MRPPALAVRVSIDPEWHCGNDKEGDQEAKSGEEGLREIHSGNASVPTSCTPWHDVMYVCQGQKERAARAGNG